MRRHTPANHLPLLATLLCGLAPCCGPDRASLDEQCAAGAADRCHELGTAKIHGRGGPTDRKGGRFAIERACELGRADACAMAGELSYGRRDRRARRFFTRGCELDNPTSCVDLAWMVEHGEGGPADANGARSHYRRACDAGNADGCFFLGLEQRPAPGGRGDATEMRRYYRRACELGSDLACQRARD